VANEDSARVLREAKIPEEKIRTLGFPVTHLFASLKHERGELKDGAKVLFMINSGKSEAPEVARRLCARKDLRLTVTVGKDENLRARINEAVATAANPVEIYGWTSEIPKLLTSNHLLISKAGGATVQESIASCTPMIITQVVPGQEEGNAQLIVENNCGSLSTTTDAIVASIDKALQNEGALYAQWQANITRLSRPDASLQTARFVLDLPPR
jgi:processive 1,2-diacylglycerol beta-glucosyltransferase